VGESVVGLLADPDRLGGDRHRQPTTGVDWALGWLVALASFAIAKGALARWKPEAWDWRQSGASRARPREVEA